MSSSQLIGLFSTGLWIELGSPVQVSASTISGFAVAPSTLGTINSYLGTCYSGSGYAGPGTVNYDVSPDLGAEELGVIGAYYSISFWNNLAQSTMGYGSDSIPWQSIAEGDTRASRASAPAIGSVYAKLSQEANLRFKYLVNVYLQNSAGSTIPRDIEYLDIQYPTFSRGFMGQ